MLSVIEQMYLCLINLYNVNLKKDVSSALYNDVCDIYDVTDIIIEFIEFGW